MAEPVTKTTTFDPARFIAAVDPPAKRADAEVLDALFRRVTGQAPRMWGRSIIGYGGYHYRYASGHEGDAPRVGFSPRKAKHSIYLSGCDDAGPDAPFGRLLARLGKHKRGVACLYVNKLADIDMAVLEELATLSWLESLAAWPEHASTG